MRPPMSSAICLSAIVLAAGTGSRSGGPIPKQYRQLGPLSVLAHSVKACLDHPSIGTVIVVVSPGGVEDAKAALGPLAERVTFVDGGAARRASVHNALEALADTAGSSSHVLVHDSARPGLTAAVLDRLIDALREGAAGAMPVLPVVDTLVLDEGGKSGDVIDRTRLRRVQTPQAFPFALLLDAHRNWDRPEEPTDDAQMVRARGHDIALVEGDARLEGVARARF